MKKNTVYTLGSLIILLICAFCFVVLPAFEGRASQQPGDTPAFGKYNGKEIKYESGSDFADYVSQYGQMYQMYGQQLDQSAYYQIFNQAFNSTVMKYAFTDAVEKSGYKVPVTAINREILPYFTDENGKYSSKDYRQAPEETKLKLRNFAESKLMANRFSDDNFGSTSETLNLTALYGLKNSTGETDFIAKMNKEQRGFKIAVFSKSDYPLEKKLEFGKQNAAKFNKYDMSIITVEDKATADNVLKRINNSEITFDDAITEYSDKNYSSTNGALTNSYQYQIENILENKEDLASVTSLAIDAVSEVIQTKAGFSIFKNKADYVKPDFELDEIQRTISAYLSTYEANIIEDYFTEKANDFIKEAKTSNFDAAASKFGAKTSDVSKFPLNYGNVDILNSIDTSVEGMANAETNENLLSKAFAIKLNDYTDPVVLNNNIVVLQYTVEGSSDDDEVNPNLLSTYDENSATEAIMKSDKLENNFLSVYFENFMR